MSEKANGCKKSNLFKMAKTPPWRVLTWKTHWKSVFFLPFVSLLSVETVSLFHLLLFMHMNTSQVPAIIGVNLVTRLFVELRRAMLSTCEYSRLPHSPRLLVEPVETRAEATGVFALWNCESTYTKPTGNGSTAELFCLHPLHFLKLRLLGILKVFLKNT